MAMFSQVPPPTMPELEEFVFHPDQFQKEAIPRRLRSEDVARFLITRLDRSTGLDPLRQAEKLIDYYDLNEVAAHLRSFLDGREANPGERRRSITITRILARSGAPEEWQFAANYYRFLAQQVTVPEAAEMVSICDALGPQADTQILRSALTALLQKGLAPNDARTVETALNMTLPRAEQANTMKRRLLSVPAREQRIAGEVALYLQLVLGYPEYLPGWAGRQLRRETWADQPAQQTVRNPDPGRAQQVAEAFRQAIAKVEQDAKLNEAAKAMKTVTCLRAVDFFGGMLSEADTAKLHEGTGRQFDVLSNY
ncbi:MAG TPA: hypothetical protein VLY24_01115 [Bryobacteraceae bacterium]|nr:hypothetical protein [Bryobacteraceae bacterium]